MRLFDIYHVKGLKAVVGVVLAGLLMAMRQWMPCGSRLVGVEYLRQLLETRAG